MPRESLIFPSIPQTLETHKLLESATAGALVARLTPDQQSQLLPALAQQYPQGIDAWTYERWRKPL